VPCPIAEAFKSRSLILRANGSDVSDGTGVKLPSRVNDFFMADAGDHHSAARGDYFDTQLILTTVA